MTDVPAKPTEQSRLSVFLDSDVFYMFKTSPVAVVSTLIFAALVLSAIFAPLIAPTNPFDPASLNLMNGFTPPIDPNAFTGETFWLGTDDQGRDVVAGLIYGFRISVLFGLMLTLFSSIVGIIIGAIQGYYGGWLDLAGQRFLEIWSSMPILFLIIIISSFVVPSFWTLLIIMLLFSWMTLVDLVRAEFLRCRNMDYVRAAHAMGVRTPVIMFRHMLPNAMVATITFLPFILNGAVVTLTSLDFIGFGLPPDAPSLGRLVGQGKANLHAPWLGISVFATLTVMLTLLVFIGEAVRDAFDTRKFLQ